MKLKMRGYHKTLSIGVDGVEMILFILNVLSLMAASAVIGFFIGRGKIEIKKKLSTQEQELLERSAKEQQETIEKYNAMMKELSQYSGM